MPDYFLHYYLLFHRVQSACAGIAASKAIILCSAVRPYKGAALGLIEGCERHSVTLTLQDEEPRATPSSSGKELLMFHYPNKGKLGMISPLLSLWMKSNHLCQTWLSSETHKNTEQICFSWSMCVPAKKQYPEGLQPSFTSLRSCTHEDVHRVPPVCTHRVCCHDQSTFSSPALRSS